MPFARSLLVTLLESLQKTSDVTIVDFRDVLPRFVFFAAKHLLRIKEADDLRFAVLRYGEEQVPFRVLEIRDCGLGWEHRMRQVVFPAACSDFQRQVCNQLESFRVLVAELAQPEQDG